ncbi:DUF4870 domain-containing protein [Leifsonia sp. McL0607]|uniref:DUF4870 domain-containing protein n=1 Tax=Leifsonia sp. McL0607 TaxID=3415672 RepID=UPI003CE996F7
MTEPTQPPPDGDSGLPPQQPYGTPAGQPAGQPTGQPAGAVPPQQAYAPGPAAPLDPAQDKQWASFAHLGGILWFLPSLIIWLVFKDRGALIDRESKEALNWQITWIIAWVASQIIGLILAFTGIGFLLFSLLIPWALYIVNLVFSILGFVRVNSGGSYRYPVNFRFIK